MDFEDFTNDFTDDIPEEENLFIESDEKKEPGNFGNFAYLKNVTSIATGEVPRLGEVDYDQTVRDAFEKVARENNAIDAELAMRKAQQGDPTGVLAAIESINARNEGLREENRNRIKEMNEVALAAAEKTIASMPKVVLNNPPEVLSKQAEVSKDSIAFNAILEAMHKKAASKLGLAGSFAWGLTPMSLAENYNLAQYVNSINGEGTLNPWTTFSHESMQQLKAHYASLSDNEKASFVESTYKYFKDTWATTDAGAASIVVDMLDDEDPSKLQVILSNIAGYTLPLAAFGTVTRMFSGARNVGTAMKMANVEKQLAEVGAKDAVIANASRNLGALGAAQIVGAATGVADAIDVAKLAVGASARVLPSSITTATSGMQDLIRSKVEKLVGDLNSTIVASNIRSGEEVTMLKNIRERYNPAYNKEVHSFDPAGPDGTPARVFFKPADDTAYLTREAAEVALKAKDPRGTLGLRIVPDTTNSGYQVPENVLQARKARRDQLEVEYLKLNSKAQKVKGTADTMAKEIESPASLVSAKPRYKTFELKFASDLDKAIYQLASKTAASKSDPEVFKYVKESLGFKTDKAVQAFITNHRKQISEYLAKTTKGLVTGDVNVPKFKATSADTPKAKFDSMTKDLEEMRKEMAFLDEQIGAMNSANKGVVQGWLLEQRIDASPLYRDLGAYTEEDIKSMVRFSFGDPSLGTSQELYANRVVGVMQSSRYQKLLTEFVRKPLESLNKKQRVQLNDALVNGDKQSKEFDDAALALMGLDEKTRIAYHTVRSLRNAMYTMRNNAAVKSLTGRGFKKLNMPLTLDEPMNMFGRVLSKDEAIGKRSYNMAKNDVSSADEAMQGQQVVYELWQPVSIGGKEYQHVAVNPSIVKELPIDEVIPYRAGEFKRVYDAPYFIRITADKEIDGVMTKVKMAHRTADNITDAKKYIAAFNEVADAYKNGTLTLEKAAKMQAYGWQPDDLMEAFTSGRFGENFTIREYPNRMDDDYLDTMKHTGGSTFTQKRGDQVLDIYGKDTNTLSPVDSLAAEISNTSFMVPMTEWRDVAVHRWYNTVKDVLPPEAQNMPAEKAFYYMVNNKHGYIGSDQRNLFAQRVQDYVLNEVSVVSKEEETWAANMRYFSEKLEGATGGKLPITGAELRQANPVEFARAITFHGFLGGMNLVQAVMQGMNAVNAVVVSPLHGAVAVKNAIPLRMALMSDREDVWRHVAKAASLGVGDVDDFVETVKAIRRSGILDGINSTSMYGAETGKFGLFNNVTRTAGGISAMPFNRGEEFSRIVSFDIARREFKKANKDIDWKSDAALNQIIKRQDDLTHNMTTANRAKWQQGLMSIPTQFMAYTMKFTLNTFYSITGTTNRVFSKKEALALVAGHGLLFGVDGNLGVAVDWAQEMFGDLSKDMDRNERLALQQGVVAAFVSHVSEMLTDEKLELAFGTRFGTFGGIANALAGFTDIIMGDKDAVELRELMLGAFGGAIDRIWGNSALTFQLFKDNMDDVSSETIIEGLKLLSTGTFSSLNNIQKAYIAEQAGNYVKSRRYDSLYYANDNELAALRLGFTLNGEYEYGKMFKTDRERTKELQSIRKELNRLMGMAIHAKQANNMEAYKNYQNVIYATLAAHQNPLERAKLRDSLYEGWKDSKLRELVLKDIMNNTPNKTVMVETGKELVR